MEVTNSDSGSWQRNLTGYLLLVCCSQGLPAYSPSGRRGFAGRGSFLGRYKESVGRWGLASLSFLGPPCYSHSPSTARQEEKRCNKGVLGWDKGRKRSLTNYLDGQTRLNSYEATDIFSQKPPLQPKSCQCKHNIISYLRCVPLVSCRNRTLFPKEVWSADDCCLNNFSLWLLGIMTRRSL